MFQNDADILSDLKKYIFDKETYDFSILLEIIIFQTVSLQRTLNVISFFDNAT